MKTLKEQTDAKIEQGRLAKPEFMENVDNIILQQKEFKKGESAAKVGEDAPRFNLPSANGKSISLESLIAKGSVVVTFYRGSWCPYCNLQLRALQGSIKEIIELGAELVAISPEVPDGSLSQDEISELNFIVLSDQNANIAKEYGVAWDVPNLLLEHMKVDRGLDLESINNGNSNILPIPATFIIAPDGKVAWRYVDIDYRTRSEPSDIINALKNLNK